jgi:hypothetical protein
LVGSFTIASDGGKAADAATALVNPTDDGVFTYP